MKRLLIVLIAIISIGMVYAANGNTLPNTETLEVSLNLGSESGTTWYDFGFSSTPVGSGKETPQPVRYDPTAITGNSISLSLKEGETGRIAENDEDSLWAYWHITSGSNLQISIKGEADMKKDSPASDTELIGWNIAVGSADAKDRDTSQIVFTHTPSKNGVGSDGSAEIRLTTDDLTGLVLTPGEYKANLTLKIENI